MSEDADLSEEVSELEETFNSAATHLQTLAASLDTGQLLGFYGLYKQATCGPCDTPAPSWYQMQAKHKWDAWKSLGEMGKEAAMGSYIRAVAKLDPSWEERDKSSSDNKSRAWVVVSRLPRTDVELKEADKTLLDWVKDGEVEKVRQSLERRREELSERDEEGMLPVHWAADRGKLAVLECLVEAGADLEASDADGQTAMHYAASCGHRPVVEYLMKRGVAMARDKSGLTPGDVADEAVKALF